MQRVSLGKGMSIELKTCRFTGQALAPARPPLQREVGNEGPMHVV